MMNHVPTITQEAFVAYDAKGFAATEAVPKSQQVTKTLKLTLEAHDPNSAVNYTTRKSYT